MDPINTLTNHKMESIHNLVKSHGKEEVLQAIANTGNMNHAEHMVSLIQFKDFIHDSEHPSSRFNKVLKHTEPSPKLSAEENQSRSNKKHMFYTLSSPVAHDNVPNFKTKAKAKAWFKSNLDHM